MYLSKIFENSHQRIYETNFFKNRIDVFIKDLKT